MTGGLTSLLQRWSGERRRLDTEIAPDAAVRLSRILTENILPFWFPSCVDRVHGGFRADCDVAGSWSDKPFKHLVPQARLTWFFAHVGRSAFGAPEHLEAARHGAAFLIEHLRDADWGGYYWQVDLAGHPRRANGDGRADDKHLYAQAFALFALAECAAATGDDNVAAEARHLFELMETRACDLVSGGYEECLSRDWQPLPDDAVTCFDRNPPSVRTLGTQLHLIEALAAYVRLTGDVAAKNRIHELAGLVAYRYYHTVQMAFFESRMVGPDPIGGRSTVIYSYGHILEAIWLLAEACAIAGHPTRVDDLKFENAFRYALAHGFDRRQGGWYHEGGPGAPASDKDKKYWVQSEALLCCLHRFKATGAAVYADCFNRTLRWIEEHQVDWRNGEWHDTVKPDGSVSGAKAGPWKAAYHNGRAMIDCHALLVP